jgi:hypothetical protein
MNRAIVQPVDATASAIRRCPETVARTRHPAAWNTRAIAVDGRRASQHADERPATGVRGAAGEARMLRVGPFKCR